MKLIKATSNPVPTIFAETTINPKLITAVATERLSANHRLIFYL
ncbi:hypothetical protein [Iningainema tapete]|nr:hypothetical protein [Iningainema tapete]